MIKYTLYENGGEFVDTFEAPSALRPGRNINIPGWKVGILRATRRDIAPLFNNDPDITAIAHIKRIKPLP